MRKTRRTDLTGRIFGRWTVLKFVCVRSKTAKWLCRCECGQVREVYANTLMSGEGKSCGCLSRELVAARTFKHGGSVGRRMSPEYAAWVNAKSRCFKANNPGYANYGGRGITMSAEWRNSFATFLRDMGKRPAGGSIGRIDNAGNYCKENCRWETWLQQCNNTRCNHLITFNGITQSRASWARAAGIPIARFRSRQRYGWSMERILSTPQSLINRSPKSYTVPEVGAYLRAKNK